MTLQRKTYVQTKEGLEAVADKIRDINLPEYGVVIEIKTGTRTLPQNSAMHLYFGWLAKAFNDAGLDMKKVLKPEVDIPWTAELVQKIYVATRYESNHRQGINVQAGTR